MKVRKGSTPLRCAIRSVLHPSWVLLPSFFGERSSLRRWAFFLFTNTHWRGILLVIPAGSWWFPHGVPFYVTVEFYFFLHRGGARHYGGGRLSLYGRVAIGLSAAWRQVHGGRSFAFYRCVQMNKKNIKEKSQRTRIYFRKALAFFRTNPAQDLSAKVRLIRSQLYFSPTVTINFPISTINVTIFSTNYTVSALTGENTTIIPRSIIPQRI